MTQTDERAMVAAADKMAADAKAAATAAQDLASSVDTTIKAGALVWEYYYTISEPLPLALSLTTRRSIAPATNAKVGDIVFVHPAGRPTMTGLTLGAVIMQTAGFVNANGGVDVNYVLPILSVAGTLTMPVRLRGFRPPAA